MKYAVDRIIEDIVVLENIETGELVEIKKHELPNEVHEGSILVKKDDVYILDENTEKERRESLRERLERLKKIKNKD